MLRLDHLQAGAHDVRIGADSRSLHWVNEHAEIQLSCFQFTLAKHPGQSFWSYTLTIALEITGTTVNRTEVLQNAKDTAQSLSDQRVLPSEWDFAQQTSINWVTGTYIQDTAHNSQVDLSSGRPVIEPIHEIESCGSRTTHLTGLRPPMSTSSVRGHTLDIAARMVKLVVGGREKFPSDNDAPTAWEDDLERLRPELNSSMPHGLDIIKSLERYVDAIGTRHWQASFLLGCALLHKHWSIGQRHVKFRRAYKAFARIVLSMLDALFDVVGLNAFKAVTILLGTFKQSALALYNNLTL